MSGRLRSRDNGGGQATAGSHPHSLANGQREEVALPGPGRHGRWSHSTGWGGGSTEATADREIQRKRSFWKGNLGRGKGRNRLISPSFPLRISYLGLQWAEPLQEASLEHHLQGKGMGEFECTLAQDWPGKPPRALGTLQSSRTDGGILEQPPPRFSYLCNHFTVQSHIPKPWNPKLKRMSWTLRKKVPTWLLLFHSASDIASMVRWLAS